MPALCPPFLLAPLPACLSLCLPQPIPSLIALYVRSGYSGSLVAGVLTFFPPSEVLPLSLVEMWLRETCSPDQSPSSLTSSLICAPSDLPHLLSYLSSSPRPASAPSAFGFYLLLKPSPSSAPGSPLNLLLSPHLPPLHPSHSHYLSSLTFPPAYPSTPSISLLPSLSTPPSHNCLTYVTSIPIPASSPSSASSLALQVCFPPTPPPDPPSFLASLPSLSLKSLKSLLLSRSPSTPLRGMEKQDLVDLAASLHRPPPDPGRPLALPVLVYSHGNAADLGLM